MQHVRILLVDDHPGVLSAVADMLGRETGLEVVGRVLSGEIALGQSALAPDLVVLDWRLPGLDGPEVLTAFKLSSRPPRVVMLTSHDDPSYRAAAERLGADGFVPKSELDAQLVPLIRSLFP